MTLQFMKSKFKHCCSLYFLRVQEELHIMGVEEKHVCFIVGDCMSVSERGRAECSEKWGFYRIS